MVSFQFTVWELTIHIEHYFLERGAQKELSSLNIRTASAFLDLFDMVPRYR
jgi:hypothetical protein